MLLHQMNWEFKIKGEIMEEVKMHQLFVYGTLQSGRCNNDLMRNGKLLESPAILKGVYRSGSISVHASDNPEDEVVGELWRVPEYDLFGSIDNLEGHPIFYKRTWIPDQYGGVWIYLLPSRADNWFRGLDF